MLRVIPALFFKFIILLTVFSSAACAQSDGARDAKALNTVVIVAENGRHDFKVEVADDAQERQLGLMYRETLAEDAGMLFDFQEVQPVSMWMKNTLIPLDIAFIDEAGVIKRIARETTPLSLEPISSGAPVIAVLEVKGGVLNALGVKEGDKVLHPMFESR